MHVAPDCPVNLRLVFHHRLSHVYDLSPVLLARAGYDGTLQLMTSSWERTLGYRAAELGERTLLQLMWHDVRAAAAAVAAILDEHDLAPVQLRLRCRGGVGRSFRLHRHFDRNERLMYIVADQGLVSRRKAMRPYGERRGAAR